MTQRHQALVGGLHTTPTVVLHDGRQHGVSVALHPLGARRLLGAPASALASTVVDLAELLGARAHELVERMAAAHGWQARFAVLDRVLTGALDVAPPPPDEVAQVWRVLCARAGDVRLGALASQVGWSRRHLSQRFRAELGLTPKTAARVLRFAGAVDLLRRRGRPGLAEVAVRCGYYDQAHLNRDWRAFAGCTPTDWLAEELPNVQDDGLRVG